MASFNSEIQTWSFTNATQATVVTLTSPINVGDFVVIPWQNGNNNINVLASVTDSGGNSWTVCTPNTADANRCCGLAFAFIGAALPSGTGTITLHWTNTSNHFKMGSILDFTGPTSTASALDQQHTSAATFGTAVSNPITTVAADTIIVYAQGQEQTDAYTVAGGFSAINEVTNSSRLDYGYRIVTAQGTYNPAGSYAVNTNWLGAIASFVYSSSTPLTEAIAETMNSDNW